ncbi:putative DNA primase/helicase [Litorimonas taeanensis]|uniref:Putative DNA primase/helicase n=1 Tax=Litorimonas taeanensis TaxID=568099 RepID=A0A420WD57_9PROT|nr:phage/plasmid primase, P4 family [Litorimonas taeanensis]RKQ68964.1 putative DNA primase/helicase [Litorimonas taeanensis]
MPRFSEEQVKPAADDLMLARLPKSDLGNARRMIERFGDDIRFVPRQGWRAWNGVCWAIDDDGESKARIAAHATADAIDLEADALKAKGPYEGEEAKDFNARIAAHRKWGADSGNAGKSRAMLDQAGALVRRDREDWDEDPYLLNVQNGTLHFKPSDNGVEAVLFPHNKQNYCTATARVAYDPEADCPLWRKHLEMCLPDIEKRAYFQRWCGYSLTGDISEQKFLIMQGQGADGKSVTINALAYMLGDYAMSVSIRSFLANDYRSGSDASPDIARLAGPARFVYVSEPKKGDKLDEAGVKSLTGGDRMTARKLRQDIFEFFPIFKMIVPCNPKPIITSSDHGTWRRIQLLEWTNRIPEAVRDRNIDRKLQAEAAGILNWAIEGLGDWMADGLNPPDAVKDAVQRYRGQSDPMGDWLDERFDYGQTVDHKIPLSELYEDYAAWCEMNSFRPMASRTFSAQLSDRQIVSVRPGGQTFKDQIQLKSGLQMMQTEETREKSRGKENIDAAAMEAGIELSD